MTFADPAKNTVAANQADAEGGLRAQDSIYTGRLLAESGPESAKK